jgi:hypothetical protein
MTKKSPIRILAEREAVATVLSEIEGVEYDTLMDDLISSKTGWDACKKYTIWEPFYDHNDALLAEVLEGFAAHR